MNKKYDIDKEYKKTGIVVTIFFVVTMIAFYALLKEIEEYHEKTNEAYRYVISMGYSYE